MTTTKRPYTKWPKTAVFTVKHRVKPKLAAVVACNFETLQRGKVIVSEPLRDNFTVEDVNAAARRLVPLAVGYDVVLPMGMEL